MAPQQHTRLSWTDIASYMLRILMLPLVLTWDLCKRSIHKRAPYISLRAIVLSILRHISQAPSYQTRALVGTTEGVYRSWCNGRGIPVTIDDALVDEAELYWLGPKRAGRVILYVHGGGFHSPINPFSLNLVHHIQRELQSAGSEVGVAVLGYSLHPEGRFPTQLRQLAVAIDHLLATGTHPSAIYLFGDSAGGNIILQFLSHLLHPLPDIGPAQSLKGPLGGAFLLSPWVRFDSQSASFVNPYADDIFHREDLVKWGLDYANDIPDSLRVYAEPGLASHTWFSGLGKVVRHMLIVAGEDELLRDDIVAFAETLKKGSDVDLDFVIQPGVHNEPLFEVALKKTHPSMGTMTPKIVKWFKQCFRD